MAYNLVILFGFLGSIATTSIHENTEQPIVQNSSPSVIGVSYGICKKIIKHGPARNQNCII
jgi:hypothetical protein